jgi:ABC-type amino acid transport system permease subunit
VKREHFYRINIRIFLVRVLINIFTNTPLIITLYLVKALFGVTVGRKTNKTKCKPIGMVIGFGCTSNYLLMLHHGDVFAGANIF